MGRAPDAKGGATRLVSVKAVSDAYPLRGRLKLRAAADGAKPAELPKAPAPGTAWVDAAVIDSRGLQAAIAAAREPPDRGPGT